MSKLSTRSISTAAFVALAAFPAVVAILNIVQAGHYDVLTQPASQLALGEDGWLMTAAFCAFGVGTLLLAEVFRRTVPENQWVAALLALNAVLTGFVPAVFPTDPTGVPMTAHGAIHDFTGLGGFILYVAIVFLAGLAFGRSSRWKSFSRASLVWGGVSAVGLLLLFVLGGLNLFGVGERIGIAAWLSWLLAAAWRGRGLDRSIERATSSKVALAKP